MADWWRNAGTDEETAAIDQMPGAREPLDENTLAVRSLITSLESCHHKADRHVGLILEAIGTGRTDKGPGRRPEGTTHPAETAWRNACVALRAWLDDNPSTATGLRIGPLTPEELLRALGEKSRLKEWQVQRVIERIESFLDPTHEYENLECDVGPYGEPGGNPPTDRYKADADLLEQTIATMIQDTEDGQPAQISLAPAIDLLMPCHWNFPQNLLIVARAIGGALQSSEPLGVCARNISLAPIRPRMRVIANTLGRFCGKAVDTDVQIDEDVLGTLGAPTPTKTWLAASLAKTLRLQLHL